jgi:RNA polymerase sigma factor (sigma-70 family)
VTTVEQLAVQVRQWRLIVNTSQAASSPELADRTRQLLRERVTATDARRRRIDREVVILSVPVDEVAEALVCDGCYSPSSLDERGSEDDGVPRGDLIGSADADLDRVELLRTLGPLCRRLGARDRRILYLRFFKGWTQREIAAELGVTQMQVSRLLSRILGTLRGGLADQESATGPTSARVSAA